MRTLAILSCCVLALVGCGRNETEYMLATSPESDAKMEKEVQHLKVSAPETLAPTLLSQPQIAYAYRFGYRLADRDIDRVQAGHIALCDTLGRARCRIGSSQRSVNDGTKTTASLKLFVDARIARAFSARLDQTASAAGGESIDRSVTGEDLSKAMIDTGARIRAKQALADRLLQLIQTRAGSVADLVAVERAFADAQEELDAARTAMAEMQGRVAMSKVEVSYESRAAAGSGPLRPVRNALAGAGETLGGSVAALLTLIVVVLPWLVLLLALRWLSRRLGWRVRWPWRRTATP